MIKRIFAALLLGCLFCLALAGCGKTDLQKSQEYMDNHPLNEKKLYSVSFCLVSDDAINPVVLSGMQAEFNRYTEANYNIHVEFVNKTAAEYGAWLEQKFTAVETARAARLAAEAAGNAANGETGGTSASGASGSLGSDIRDVYPEIGEDQFDLIYIADYDMLFSLVGKGRLRDLTDELTGKDYRLIKTYMTEKFFNQATLNGKIFAVPNCRVMANYKYMCVNVEKAKYYNHPFENTITDYSSTSMMRAAMEYDSLNPDDYIKQNLIGDYAARYTLAETDADGNPAWWVYGSADDQIPVINQSDLMQGMLAVTSYAFVDDGGTKSTAEDDFCPAVKILYAIDTVPALHTVLQYGAPTLTYNLKTISSGDKKVTVVEKITGTEYSYDVDPKYTGNYLSLYPTEEEYENDTMEQIRLQNNETAIKADIRLINVKISEPKGAECTATVSVPFGKEGDTVVFTAIPADGYRFEGWMVSASGDNMTPQSENRVYSLKVEDKDITLTAQFAAIE